MVVAAAVTIVVVAKAVVGLVKMKIIYPKLFINPSLHSAELRTSIIITFDGQKH